MAYLDTAALLAALTQLQERDYPEKNKEELEAEYRTLQVGKSDGQSTAAFARMAQIDAALADLNLLGGQVRIRELTAAERQQANEAAQGDEGGPADNALYRALVVQLGVKEPQLTAAHVAALRSGRSSTIQRLAVAILTLSEATPEAVRLKSDQDDNEQ